MCVGCSAGWWGGGVGRGWCVATTAANSWAALAEWLKSKGVELRAVAPASPWENGFVESFHSRLRDEFLDRALDRKSVV